MSVRKSLKSLGVAVAALVAVAGGPAHAEWLKAQSAHFIVYGDTSEGAIRDYTRKIERFDALLRIYFPVPSEFEAPPLPVYLAHGRADMRQVWTDMPSGVGGFYTPGTERIFAISDQSRSEGDATLFHEYGHHFMFQNFPGAYPAWFVEGFAEYFATADLTPGRMRVGLFSRGRMNSLTQGANSWVPFEDLLRSRTSTLTASQGPTYYAEAWALTNYLMSSPERQQMMRLYLRAIAGGRDPVEALQGTINRTPDQLQSDVRSYLLRITAYTLQQEISPAEVTVTRLPASAPDVIWLDLRLTRFVKEEDRPGNLAEATRAMERHPGDPWAARTLAMANLDMKQPEAAVAALAPALAADPNDAQALRLEAMALMDEGDAIAETDADRRLALYGQARRALGQAYQADATDFRIYMALSRSREVAANYPTDNDLETLKLAVDLAPQVPDVRLRAAAAFMAREQYPQAILYLMPVANNPHGGEGLQAIRDLLAEARRRAGLAPAQDDAPPGAATSEEATPSAEDATGGQTAPAPATPGAA